jgi:nicotinamidase-related amidase
VRAESGRVIFIQHCGVKGDDFEPQTPGWQFLPELLRDPTDIVVRKQLNDPFAGTDLQQRLREIAPDRVLITGWATDLCVDATVRSAVSHHHHVVVVADGHTLNDRPHLDAASVIRHHHWVWGDLITQRSVKLVSADELLA